MLINSCTISSLIDVASFALKNGNPDPSVPSELASKLATCVTSGIKVLVIGGPDNWLAVLRPRKEDSGCVMAYAYGRDPELGWQEEPVVIDQGLNCQPFFGGDPILGLDQLDGYSELLRSWMSKPV